MDEMAMAPWPRALDEEIPVSRLKSDGDAAAIGAGLVWRVGAR